MVLNTTTFGQTIAQPKINLQKKSDKEAYTIFIFSVHAFNSRLIKLRPLTGMGALFGSNTACNILQRSWTDSKKMFGIKITSMNCYSMTY